MTSASVPDPSSGSSPVVPSLDCVGVGIEIGPLELVANIEPIGVGVGVGQIVQVGSVAGGGGVPQPTVTQQQRDALDRLREWLKKRDLKDALIGTQLIDWLAEKGVALWDLIAPFFRENPGDREVIEGLLA